MAIAYAKLYELIHKKIKDEREADELYNAIIEIIKESKVIVKNELKDELKDELATKKDIDLVREEMKAMEERILRYVDNRFNQLLIVQLIILFAIIITNPNAIELIKLLFGFK